MSKGVMRFFDLFVSGNKREVFHETLPGCKECPPLDY